MVPFGLPYVDPGATTPGAAVDLSTPGDIWATLWLLPVKGPPKPSTSVGIPSEPTSKPPWVSSTVALDTEKRVRQSLG